MDPKYKETMVTFLMLKIGTLMNELRSNYYCFF